MQRICSASWIDLNAFLVDGLAYSKNLIVKSREPKITTH